MITLRPYLDSDLSLLIRSNTSEQKEHVGGPESDEKLLARHRKYIDTAEPGRFQIFIVENESRAVGYIGYWERTWDDKLIYETGWGIFPEYQGQGLASLAISALIEILKPISKHLELHAYPSIHNDSSNALCRKAGFKLIGPCDFEYPPGHVMKSNDWCLSL